MKLSFLSLLFLAGNLTSCAQKDSTVTIKEVEAKLKNGSASVSGILSDKKYLALHPATAFRELIKKYSTDAILVITSADEPGKKIKVLCTVKGEDGLPVSNALVYLYQTDARGWYAADAPHVGGNEGDFRHARLFGYVKTKKNGQFELHTTKPSGYPRSDLPAHIHIHFEAPGFQSYGTEFLFDDDDRLVGTIREQAIQNNFLVAKPEKTAAPFQQQFSYTVIMTK